MRAIGTSNFKPGHLDRLLAETGVVPDVNQIQLSPSVTRADARAYHAERGIVTESWSPARRRRCRRCADPVVIELAERYGRTPAQIVLRWHIELGLVAIPKSATPERIRQNIEIFDFSLTPEDVAAISALDQGEAAAVDSDTFGH